MTTRRMKHKFSNTFKSPIGTYHWRFISYLVLSHSYFEVIPANGGSFFIYRPNSFVIGSTTRGRSIIQLFSFLFFMIFPFFGKLSPFPSMLCLFSKYSMGKQRQRLSNSSTTLFLRDL